MVAYFLLQSVTLCDCYSKGRGFLSLPHVSHCTFSLQWVALSLNVTNMSHRANYSAFQRKKKKKFSFLRIWNVPIQSYQHMGCDWPFFWPHLQLCHCFGYSISNDTFSANWYFSLLSFLFLVKKNNSIFFVFLPS